MPPSELAKWYRASHLFVFPSVNEGLARVLFEAMSSGLPVIATERSGAEDCITSGLEGNVVPARNVDGAGRGHPLALPESRGIRRHGKAARSRIERNLLCLIM